MAKWSEYKETLGYSRVEDEVLPLGELLQKMGYVLPHGNVELMPLDFFKGGHVIGVQELDRPTRLALQAELFELIFMGMFKRIVNSRYKDKGKLCAIKLDYSNGGIIEVTEGLDVALKGLASNVVGFVFEFHDKSLGCREFYVVEYDKLSNYDCGLIDTYLDSKYFSRDFINNIVLGFDFNCLNK